MNGRFTVVPSGACPNPFRRFRTVNWPFAVAEKPFPIAASALLQRIKATGRQPKDKSRTGGEKCP